MIQCRWKVMACSLWQGLAMWSLLSASLEAGEVTPPSYEITTPPGGQNIPDFYQKFTHVGGYPIVASAAVNDYALKEAAFLIHTLLAGRADLLEALVQSGSRFCILGVNEYTTDLPDFSWLEPKDFWDARARGTGGSETDPCCSCGEENLLGYPGDPYAQENILIHEFAHTVHLRALPRTDPTFDGRVKAAYEAAMAAGRWKGTYAATNHHEYFAEGVQSWFSNNRAHDHDHNHVNTRALLLEYDPALAALCREVFGDHEFVYTKPEKRLHGHLQGYDPATAPTFAWPERLRKAKQEIAAPLSVREAATYEKRELCGWVVHLSPQLLKEQPAELTRALELIEEQLTAILRVVPEAARRQLQKVPLWVSPPYPGFSPRAEYHPAAEWLREHGRDPAMARAVEFTNVSLFEKETKRMPWFVLHELAHAYHHQVLGYDEPRLLAVFEAAQKNGRYEDVACWTGEKEIRRRAYALTNVQEYFAEGTEAFFGRNDFEPFTREELKAFDSELERLLDELWHQPLEAQR